MLLPFRHGMLSGTKALKALFLFLVFPLDVYAAQLEKATFAGGCFWCVEDAFEGHAGIQDVVSGFMGGQKVDPTYKEVARGGTGHREVVQVTYEPERIDYRTLLNIFWRNIDPTDAGGQFVDRGEQYSSAIFYHTDEQKHLAAASKKRLEEKGPFREEIVTLVLPADAFYPAPEEHQDYYKEHSFRYNFYKNRSGRPDFLDEVWGEDRKADATQPPESFAKPGDEALKSMLTPLQYEVTQEDGTEPAFRNEYWDNKRRGIYVDLVSGEALFSSNDKFESGTGWPSFTRPLVKANIVEKPDRGFFTVRTEVRSRHADSHLGHVFEDGPEPTGLRYCVNSAALRFIPVEELEEAGYGQFRSAFAE